MKKDILQQWADATGMYIVLPKRWPDEDSATYLHLFYTEPHLDDEGEWIDGISVESVDITKAIPFSVRSMNYKESLRKPKISSWENYLATGHFLKWSSERMEA